jgi:recombination protein RecT
MYPHSMDEPVWDEQPDRDDADDRNDEYKLIKISKMETNQQLAKQQPAGIRGLMSNEAVKNKFAEILGKNANAFISSVTTIATTGKLMECEPRSILSAAIAAASLNLQVTPSLGFAAIVPYGKSATFMIMSKGLIQLALRSGQFRTINVTEIYEGEMNNENRLTGEFDFTGKKKSDNIVGYAAYFELLNGFSKALYMTLEQIKSHGKRYSKTYDFAGSSWKANFEGMARKTVLKLLLARYAPLSVEMGVAITQDQAAMTVNDDLELSQFSYVDNDETDTAPPPPTIDPLVTATRRTQEPDPIQGIDVASEPKVKRTAGTRTRDWVKPEEPKLEVE